MSKKHVAAALLLGAAAVPATLLACGDKFLMPTRGTRFQQAPINRAPAAVLLYANPSSPLPGALSRLSVDATLRKAGYRPTFVTTLDGLEAALARGGWDVIVVDVADGASVRSRVDRRAAAAVLPVLLDAPDTAVKQARAEYKRIIKSPGRGQAFVDGIDDVLASRQAEAASNKQK